MNHESKQMVINALINVVNAAPKAQSQIGTAFQNVSKEQFDIWMKYVYSVIDISYNYTGLDVFPYAKIEIDQLARHSQLTIDQRIQQICTGIYNLAKALIQPYEITY